MGKKYIIELLDECDSEFKGIMMFGLTPRNQISAEIIPEESLTPYTEPDMEQVRKEAYDKGYENGFVAGHLKAEKSGQSFYEDGYKRGLSDAWEAARKICLAESEGGFSGKTVCYIFNTEYYRDALKDYTPAKAIEKIRQYEQEKEEQIQVGDEVINQNKTAVVTEITNRYTRIMYSDGSGYALFAKGLTKTGRHFPEIAAVLEKMKES